MSRELSETATEDVEMPEHLSETKSILKLIPFIGRVDGSASTEGVVVSSTHLPRSTLFLKGLLQQELHVTEIS